VEVTLDNFGRFLIDLVGEKLVWGGKKWFIKNPVNQLI